MRAYHNVSLIHVAETDVMGNTEVITGVYSVIKTTEFENFCDLCN
jgi:hypothetical protein